MAYENSIGFFNLNDDGSSAIVRLLHSTTETMERAVVHTIADGTRRRTVKCVGQGCPICERDVASYQRLYIHLYDYTDGLEKVWSRTANPNFLATLGEFANNWGNLSQIVFKITRKGDEFPKYECTILPPTNYPMPNCEVDAKIAYRFYMHRSADELNEFYRTGVMPPHEKKEFVPKAEYAKRTSNAGGNNAPSYTPKPAYQASNQNPYQGNGGYSPKPQYQSDFNRVAENIQTNTAIYNKQGADYGSSAPVGNSQKSTSYAEDDDDLPFMACTDTGMDDPFSMFGDVTPSKFKRI